MCLRLYKGGRPSRGEAALATAATPYAAGRGPIPRLRPYDGGAPQVPPPRSLRPQPPAVVTSGISVTRASPGAFQRWAVRPIDVEGQATENRSPALIDCDNAVSASRGPANFRGLSSLCVDSYLL